MNFSPHVHLSHVKKTYISNEAWIVISGKLRVIFYDLDKSKVYEDVLKRGDISILFEGGHVFQPLTKNTIILKLKMDHIWDHIKKKKIYKN